MTNFAPEAEHVGQIRNQLQRFLAANAPREKRMQWDREHTWPRELFREIADMGLIGLTIPAEYGGSGQDLMAAVAVIVGARNKGPGSGPKGSA